MTEAEFTARLDATPDALTRLRAGLRAWLSDTGAATEERDDIVLACWEAAANAIEHPLHAVTVESPVRVVARHRHGHILVCVADTGTWRDRQAPRADRGHGLKLIEALMDRVRIERSPHGTRVLMCRSLSTQR